MSLRSMLASPRCSLAAFLLWLIALAIGLALVSCGSAGPWTGVFTDDAAPVTLQMQTLEDDDLVVLADPDTLGFTQRSGLNTWTCDARRSLLEGDPRLVGVEIHEALAPLRIIGGLPPEADETWFVVSGDTQPLDAPVSAAEAAWALRVLRSYPDITHFEVEAQAWNAAAVAEACDRLNAALGSPVYRD